MKLILVLALITVASAQFFQQRHNFRPRFRPQQFRVQQQPAPQQQVNSGGRGAVHDTRGNSQYHFSWRADGGRKYSHGGAVQYCRNIGWDAVSLETGGESSYISGVIGSNGQAYIWTSGTKRGRGFIWGNGAPVQPLNWSRTGLNRSPQPDNREGNENCLAILNQFYPNDGITWHDVGCGHQKPVICERQLNRG